MAIWKDFIYRGNPLVPQCDFTREQLCTALYRRHVCCVQLTKCISTDTLFTEVAGMKVAPSVGEIEGSDPCSYRLIRCDRVQPHRPIQRAPSNLTAVVLNCMGCFQQIDYLLGGRHISFATVRQYGGCRS
jgi:hypothetical protein